MVGNADAAGDAATEILPSSGNESGAINSGNTTVDTVILPSGRHSENDDGRINEVVNQKKSRFASEACGGSSQSGGYLSSSIFMIVKLFDFLY
jgi:hypothetical protein